MVGINVAIRAGAQGISFAIPVDSMIQAVAEMLSTRRRNGIWHGLACRDCVGAECPVPVMGLMKKVSPAEAEGAPARRELLVERVEAGSPAAQAGLQPGDIVLQMADFRVLCSLDLERALLDHGAGDRVPVVVRRKGAEKRLDLVLQPMERDRSAPADLAWRKLGLRLKPANSELVTRASPQLHGGMTVLEVNAGSPADRAGIQRGDILVGLHQWETLTLDNVSFVLTHPDLATFNPLSFYIVRAGQVRRGWLQQID
jgi:serine protease Do